MGAILAAGSLFFTGIVALSGLPAAVFYLVKVSRETPLPDVHEVCQPDKMYQGRSL